MRFGKRLSNYLPERMPNEAWSDVAVFCRSHGHRGADDHPFVPEQCDFPWYGKPSFFSFPRVPCFKRKLGKGVENKVLSFCCGPRSPQRFVMVSPFHFFLCQKSRFYPRLIDAPSQALRSARCAMCAHCAQSNRSQNAAPWHHVPHHVDGHHRQVLALEGRSDPDRRFDDG